MIQQEKCRRRRIKKLSQHNPLQAIDIAGKLQKLRQESVIAQKKHQPGTVRYRGQKHGQKKQGLPEILSRNSCSAQKIGHKKGRDDGNHGHQRRGINRRRKRPLKGAGLHHGCDIRLQKLPEHTSQGQDHEAAEQKKEQRQGGSYENRRLLRRQRHSIAAAGRVLCLPRAHVPGHHRNLSRFFRRLARLSPTKRRT